MQRSRLLAAVAAGVALVSTSGLASAQGLDTTVTNAFKWRQIGPSNFMGRVSDVQGIPSPSKTLFVAAAGGGIWKSQNNGISWRPVFDDKDVVAMGMLAIAPSGHEHHVRRHGRAELAKHHRAGRRRLQVHRRRRCTGRSWASRRRSTSAASRSTRATPTPCTWRRSARRGKRAASAASTRRPTAARRGS